MTSYLILLIVTLVCALASIFPVARRPAVVVVFVILVGFAGFRSQIGWDYEAYQYLYDYFASYSLVEAFSAGQAVDALGFEFGFALLVWGAAVTGANYQLVLAVLTVGLCLFSAYRLSPSALPVFLLIYMWYGYNHNFSILRQGLAAGMIFFAIAIFDERKKLAVALYAVASTLHMSAVILTPFLAACIRYSTRKMVLIALGLCWVLSLSSFLSGGIFTFLELIGRDRWHTLLQFGELTNKVGVSLILIEYTLLALLLWFSDDDSFAIRFARGVLVYRLLIYGLLNDISIAWERSSAFADPMYALALATILTAFIAKFSRTAEAFLLNSICVVAAVSFYVGFKYERMLSSEPRTAGERSHFERFIPYKSIFED